MPGSAVVHMLCGHRDDGDANFAPVSLRHGANVALMRMYEAAESKPDDLLPGYAGWFPGVALPPCERAVGYPLSRRA